MGSNEGVRVVDAPSCPICGAEGDILYEGLKDRHWGAPGIWAFRRCPQCRHLWLDPRPEPEGIGKLYGRYITHREAGPRPFAGGGLWPSAKRGALESLGYAGLARGRTDRLLGRLVRLVPPLWDECEGVVRGVRGPPGGGVLDIGCGNGDFLETMRQLGWEVAGVEPDPTSARIANARGLNVREAAVEDASLPPDRFEAVTMNHVIEHVPDPNRVLDEARRALRPGGALVILTPNSDAWGHRKFGSSWFHLDPPRHLHVFHAAGLVRLAQRAGLTVSGCRTTSRTHFVRDASVSVRRSGRFLFTDADLKPSRADGLFRLVEGILLPARPSMGEELVLSCTKYPATRTGPSSRPLPRR